MAGELIRKRENQWKFCRLIPEHNAIHQCCARESSSEVKRLILTVKRRTVSGEIERKLKTRRAPKR